MPLSIYLFASTRHNATHNNMYIKGVNFDAHSLSSTAPLLASNDGSSNYEATKNARREYHFFKGNGLTSKARIRSTDDREFCLDAEIHQFHQSSIELYAGKNKNGSRIGTVTFPSTFNNFHVHLANDDTGPDGTPNMIEARARVGVPHPNAYLIKLPATTTSRSREVSWTISSSATSTLVSYRLCDNVNQLIASWSLVSDKKYQAVLRWHVSPPSELEETVVLMSFIGCLSRLKLKPKGDCDDWMSMMARHNSFVFMATLGAAVSAT